MKFYDVLTTYGEYTKGGWPLVPQGLSPAKFYPAAQKVMQSERFYQEAMSTEKVFETINANNAEGRWYALGCPTYKIYPGVLEGLAATSIDIPVAEFEMPFPVFALRFPETAFREGPGKPYLRSVMVVQERWLDARSQKLLEVMDINVTAPLRLNLLSTWSYPDQPFSYLEGGTTYRFTLKPEATIAQCIEGTPWIAEPPDDNYWPGSSIMRQITAIAVSTCFVAIGANRDLIRPETKLSTREKLRRERAVKKYGATADEYRRGWAVGADIKLPRPYDQPPHGRTNQEGERRELHFGHIRSGHCRWQMFKDETGEWRRRLIFIKPTVVRPDLPLKPKLTERAIRGEAS